MMHSSLVGADEALPVRAAIVGIRGTVILRAGRLTKDFAARVARDARGEKRVGTRLCIMIPPAASDREAAAVEAEFSGLRKHGIAVSVTRSPGQ